jgi:hypothetical protein
LKDPKYQFNIENMESEKGDIEKGLPEEDTNSVITDPPSVVSENNIPDPEDPEDNPPRRDNPCEEIKCYQYTLMVGFWYGVIVIIILNAYGYIKF